MINYPINVSHFSPSQIRFNFLMVLVIVTDKRKYERLNTSCRKEVMTAKNNVFWNVLQFFCCRNLLTFLMNLFLASSVYVSTLFFTKSS